MGPLWWADRWAAWDAEQGSPTGENWRCLWELSRQTQGLAQFLLWGWYRPEAVLAWCQNHPLPVWAPTATPTHRPSCLFPYKCLWIVNILVTMSILSPEGQFRTETKLINMLVTIHLIFPAWLVWVQTWGTGALPHADCVPWNVPRGTADSGLDHDVAKSCSFQKPSSVISCFSPRSSYSLISWWACLILLRVNSLWPDLGLVCLSCDFH